MCCCQPGVNFQHDGSVEFVRSGYPLYTSNHLHKQPLAAYILYMIGSPAVNNPGMFDIDNYNTFLIVVALMTPNILPRQICSLPDA